MKLALVSVVAAVVLCAIGDDEQSKLLERGRVCTQRFYAGELEPLWSEFDDALKKAFAGQEKLRAFRDQAVSQLGAETSIVEETTDLQGQARVYSRKARFENVPVVIEVSFAFDEADKISGFYVRPVPKEAPSEFLEYTTKTKLSLPFEGEWSVFWGGRTLAQNYHTASVDQRFAYDLLIVKDGKSHAGDGKRNEDYHCFGLPLFAPSSGVVVTAVDGVEDNPPGVMNPRQAAGNHVIIDHENGEYSLLAHFQKGTLKVKEGDRVESGAALGSCGNSGNSSEPHLHYHLQNTAVFGKGQGLPAQFENYAADEKPVERGEPVKGQRIARR